MKVQSLVKYMMVNMRAETFVSIMIRLRAGRDTRYDNIIS
jgi:hypothetical protein